MLRVVDLTVEVGHRLLVAEASFTVAPGDVVGLVGPNGAGKTTTLRMATGLLRPDAGLVVVDGVEVWRDPVEAKRRIGVLPEDLRLFERLTYLWVGVNLAAAVSQLSLLLTVSTPLYVGASTVAGSSTAI